MFFLKCKSLIPAQGIYVKLITRLVQLRKKENKQGNNENVLVDEEMLAYADDGYHLQCYHTPQSILEETALAGLKLNSVPQKVYYPWELCRQFGYGFYPQSQQEIWDWFIVAEKAQL